MLTGDYLPTQRGLASAIAWLILLSMLMGLAMAFAPGQGWDEAHLLSAHRNGLTGAFWMLAVAWTMPMLSYGPAGLGRLTVALVIANYANLFLPALRAMLHVDGRGFTGQTSNDVLYVMLLALVHVPSLGAALGWVAGFRGR